MNFIQKHAVLFSLSLIVISFLLYIMFNVLFETFHFDFTEEQKSQFLDGASRVCCSILIILIAKIALGFKFIFHFTTKNFKQGMVYISPVCFLLIWSLLLLFIVKDSNGESILSPVTVLLIFFSNIMTGFYEELLFRGLLVQNLLTTSKKFSLAKIVTLSSLAFGLIHIVEGISFQILAAFFSGIFTIAVFIRTKNIWPVIIEHAFWDIAILLAYTNNPNGISIISRIEEISASGISFTAIVGAILPLLIVLLPAPLSLFGVFLLRKSKHEEIKALWGLKYDANGNAIRP